MDVDAFLNLKVLTDPVQNPLARMYMEPFLQKRDLFRARYLDYYIFQQDVRVSRTAGGTFHFKPAQLFYNLTHVALFFYNGQDSISPKFLTECNSPFSTNASEPCWGVQTSVGYQNARALALKGHYVLDTWDVGDLQVGLGSSNTPLFSQPLNTAQLNDMTVDFFQKYGRENMVGDVILDPLRVGLGDAFYVIDFTHARGAGYFVDSDNMISITGTIRSALSNSAYTPSTPVEPDVSPPTVTDATVSVIAVMFYTNNLEILLDQGGSVIVSQV